MRLEPRRGVTLIEVLATLAVAGLVTLGCVLLLQQSSDESGRLVNAGNVSTRGGNGHDELRRLFRDAERSNDTTHAFRGDERSVAAMTRCRTSRGWTAPCSVIVTIDSLADSSIVGVQVDSGPTWPLERRRGAWSFRYFDHTSADSTWVKHWHTVATLPTAVALVTDADTVMLAVGPSRD
ncbi:MAG TPA: prepilin-type N-terminal cleavage/methylation domain-containing protein [Gemmatimonadaceae bacterium]|nr:prepilin-type N-terminal cleavage/methylation domain-containing protein [Gemmatimonadaceae bacterium]